MITTVCAFKYKIPSMIQCFRMVRGDEVGGDKIELQAIIVTLLQFRPDG